MIAVALDPGILLFNLSSQDALKFRLNHIRTINQLNLSSGWIKFLLPKRTTRLLAELGLFPAFPLIARALSEHQLTAVFTAQDVSYTVSQLLQCAPLEDFTSASDVAWDSFSSVPSVFPFHIPQNLDNELERILVLSLIDSVVQGSCRSLFAISTPFNTKSLSATADIAVVEPDSLAGFLPIELPKTISGDLANVRNLEEIASLLDPGCVWSLGESALAIKVAIQLRCRSRLKAEGNYKGWAKLPRFKVGEHFLGSAQQHERVKGLLLQKSASLVLDAPNIEVRPLMTSTAADAVQVVRKKDGALAFRMHLTKGHEAMRLMFWQCSDGAKELANVGNKAELIIMHGDPSKAT